MITLEELTADIAELESKPASYPNCERLAVLYTIHDRLQRAAEQSQTATFSCVAEPETVNDSAQTSEPGGKSTALPAYTVYVENKRKYQQGDISKEKVLKNLETLSEEIKGFINRLYRNTDMPEERNILSKTIAEINVGNL